MKKTHWSVGAVLACSFTGFADAAVIYSFQGTIIDPLLGDALYTVSASASPADFISGIWLGSCSVTTPVSTSCSGASFVDSSVFGYGYDSLTLNTSGLDPEFRFSAGAFNSVGSSSVVGQGPSGVMAMGTLNVVADVPPPTSVPEPNTLGLFCLALLGLGISRVRAWPLVRSDEHAAAV